MIFSVGRRCRDAHFFLGLYPSAIPLSVSVTSSTYG